MIRDLTLVIGGFALGLLVGHARAAESDRHWQMYRKLPMAAWEKRGGPLSNQQACLLDLASETIVAPAGTRLKCQDERKQETQR